MVLILRISAFFFHQNTTKFTNILLVIMTVIIVRNKLTINHDCTTKLRYLTSSEPRRWPSG